MFCNWETIDDKLENGILKPVCEAVGGGEGEAGGRWEEGFVGCSMFICSRLEKNCCVVVCEVEEKKDVKGGWE
jgi:hypothetical protein